MEKTIYDLELHEALLIETPTDAVIHVTRVAGGWIYTTCYRGQSWRVTSSAFVPYDNEFKQPGGGGG